VQILYQVIYIFYAHAESDQRVGQSQGQALFLWNTGMGHGGWVTDQGFHTSEGFSQGKEVGVT
jgi:hypothetical protein